MEFMRKFLDWAWLNPIFILPMFLITIILTIRLIYLIFTMNSESPKSNYTKLIVIAILTLISWYLLLTSSLTVLHVT